MLELYATIGEKPRDERIMDGVKVYTRDMIMPYARPAGLWDRFMGELKFDELSDLAERAYPLLTGGAAQEVLGAVFLMGEGLVPAGGLTPLPEVGAEALPLLHTIALRGSAAESSLDADVGALQDAGLLVSTPAGVMLTAEGHRVHETLLAQERGGVDLERLGAAYERFLAVNGPMKALCARAGAAADDPDERFALVGQAAELLERIEPALRRTQDLLPRFSGYARRLQAALRRTEEGEESYLISPRVDSVHTVWMECHEDYLQTLGRSREAEGSY
jgi:hypothetical protein